MLTCSGSWVTLFLPCWRRFLRVRSAVSSSADLSLESCSSQSGNLGHRRRGLRGLNACQTSTSHFVGRMRLIREPAKAIAPPLASAQLTCTLRKFCSLLLSRRSSDSSHSQTTRTFQLKEASALSASSSRFLFRSNLGSQYSGRADGRFERRQPSCWCQKHP